MQRRGVTDRQVTFTEFNSIQSKATLHMAQNILMFSDFNNITLYI